MNCIRQETELRWIAHPLRDDPPTRSALLLALLLGVSIVVSFSFQNGWLGFLSLGLLVASLSRYFFPTRYVLDGAGVGIFHLASRRQIPWGQIRRYTTDANGIFLSPFERPHRLETFRGNFLRFSGNREEVIRFVCTQVRPS